MGSASRGDVPPVKSRLGFGGPSVAALGLAERERNSYFHRRKQHGKLRYRPRRADDCAGDESGRVHFLRLVEAEKTEPPIGDTKILLLQPKGAS
jgi:hypothetical protein